MHIVTKETAPTLYIEAVVGERIEIEITDVPGRRYFNYPYSDLVGGFGSSQGEGVASFEMMAIKAGTGMLVFEMQHEWDDDGELEPHLEVEIRVLEK